jgi:hypothetical protein
MMFQTKATLIRPDWGIVIPVATLVIVSAIACVAVEMTCNDAEEKNDEQRVQGKQ